MLNNLRAEIVRKGLDPVSTISETIGCTEKTAKSKLSEKTAFSVPEAVKVIENIFYSDEFTIEYLFKSSED